MPGRSFRRRLGGRQVATARARLPTATANPTGAGKARERAGGPTPQPPPPPPLPPRPPPPPLVGRRLGCRTFCLSSRSQSGALRLSRDCAPVKRLALGWRAGSPARVAGTPRCVPPPPPPPPRSRRTRDRLFRFGLKPRPGGAASPWPRPECDSAPHVLSHTPNTTSLSRARLSTLQHVNRLPSRIPNLVGFPLTSPSLSAFHGEKPLTDCHSQSGTIFF